MLKYSNTNSWVCSALTCKTYTNNELSNQAESIATAAEATYAKNTTLWEENTYLHEKLHIHEEHINAITAQLHQLQLQTAVQAFAMSMQTMGQGDKTIHDAINGLAMEVSVEVTQQ